jgi:hypothetical protein
MPSALSTTLDASMDNQARFQGMFRKHREARLTSPQRAMSPHEQLTPGIMVSGRSRMSTVEDLKASKQSGSLHHGVLWKKARGKGSVFSRRNWKQRYFALLLPDVDTPFQAKFLYYEMEVEPKFWEGSLQPKGIFIIDRCTQIHLVKSKRHEHRFDLVNDDETFRLHANNEKEFKLWVKTISSLLEILQNSVRKSRSPTTHTVAKESNPLEQNDGKFGVTRCTRGGSKQLFILFTSTLFSVVVGLHVCYAIDHVSWFMDIRIIVGVFCLAVSSYFARQQYHSRTIKYASTSPACKMPPMSLVQSSPGLVCPVSFEPAAPGKIANLREAISTSTEPVFHSSITQFLSNRFQSDLLLSRFVLFFGDKFETSMPKLVEVFHRFTEYIESPVREENMLKKITAEFVESFIRQGAIVMTGKNTRTETGKRVILIRPALLAMWNTEDIAIFMAFILLLTSGDDDWGLNGFIVVLDMKGFSLMQAYSMQRVDWKKYAPGDSFPMRMMGIVILNQPTWSTWLWSVACQFLPAKIQRRVTFLGKDLSELYCIVGQNMLPPHFGAGSNERTVQEFLQEFPDKIKRENNVALYFAAGTTKCQKFLKPTNPFCNPIQAEEKI